MQRIEFKRRSTFKMSLTLKDAAGAVLAIPATDLRMELRKSPDAGKELLAVLSIAATGVAGTYEASFAGSTDEWPIGLLFTDVRAEIDSDIRYSNTLAINVVVSYTQEEVA